MLPSHMLIVNQITQVQSVNNMYYLVEKEVETAVYGMG